jgi:hypothetical protein
MDQGAHSLDGSDSLPSPVYVPIFKFVSNPSLLPAEAVPWQKKRLGLMLWREVKWSLSLNLVLIFR